MIAGSIGLLIIEANVFILEDSNFIGGSTDFYLIKQNLRGGFVNSKSTDLLVTSSSF